MRFQLLLATAAMTWAVCASAADLSPAQAAVFAFAPTVTQPARQPGHWRASRAWAVNGAKANYDAVIDEFPVATGGKTVGFITTYGYVRPAPGVPRPVVFLFNGGPGASSWSLHLEGFGPVRYNAASDGFEDNPDTLLDQSDLVFIDPLGTGESAPFTDTDPQPAWSSEGDARACLAAVQAWLKEHGREQAPIYLVGESYGGARVAAMLHVASPGERAQIRGVALLSPALSIPADPAVQSEGRFPSMAATAWYHRRAGHDLASGMEAYEQALDTKVPSPAEAAAAIGLPGDRAAEHALPDAATFERELLADRQQIVGNLDTRVTASAALMTLRPPYSDPGMTLGKRPSTAMARYLSSLGVPPPLAYRMLNLSINSGWDYGGPPDRWPFAGYLAAAMLGQPQLHLFTASGIYDLTTPANADVLTLKRAGVPSERWGNHLYSAGHTIGEDAEARPRLAADLRHFIELTSRP